VCTNVPGPDVPLYGLGHLEEAIASYRRAMALRPAYATALANLATLHSERGDLPEAERCCRRALALRHDMHGVHGELGRILGSMGRSDEALVCYRTVIQLAPDNPEAHTTLVAALWGLGRLDEAIASSRCAMALCPSTRRRWPTSRCCSGAGTWRRPSCCRRALARTGVAEIHHELGTVLGSAGSARR
jgi:Flp pilus assembly protein TadD